MIAAAEATGRIVTAAWRRVERCILRRDSDHKQHVTFYLIKIEQKLLSRSDGYTLYLSYASLLLPPHSIVDAHELSQPQTSAAFFFSQTPEHRGEIDCGCFFMQSNINNHRRERPESSRFHSRMCEACGGLWGLASVPLHGRADSHYADISATVPFILLR